MFDLNENLLDENSNMQVELFRLFQEFLKSILPRVLEGETLEDNRGIISLGIIRVDEEEVIVTATLLSGKIKKININSKMKEVCSVLDIMRLGMNKNKILIYLSDEEETQASTIEDVLFIFNLDLEAEY